MNIITATDVHERLVELANDGELILQGGLEKSDVQAWYDGLDIQSRRSSANAAIERTLITDIHAETTISGQQMTVAEAIQSRNDDPANFNCAYILGADRTFVQYTIPRVGGKQPMDKPTAETEMQDHVERLVARQVSADILAAAVQQFSK
jgi:hypothetical protein